MVPALAPLAEGLQLAVVAEDSAQAIADCFEKAKSKCGTDLDVLGASTVAALGGSFLSKLSDEKTAGVLLTKLASARRLSQLPGLTLGAVSIRRTTLKKMDNVLSTVLAFDPNPWI